MTSFASLNRWRNAYLNETLKAVLDFGALYINTKKSSTCLRSKMTDFSWRVMEKLFRCFCYWAFKHPAMQTEAFGTLRGYWTEVMKELGLEMDAAKFVQAYHRDLARENSTKGFVTTWEWSENKLDGGLMSEEQQMQSAQ